jgi:hypothetical protein
VTLDNLKSRSHILCTVSANHGTMFWEKLIYYNCYGIKTTVFCHHPKRSSLAIVFHLALFFLPYSLLYFSSFSCCSLITICCCHVSISDVILFDKYICCNVHVIVMFRGSKGRCLVTTTMHALLETVQRKCFLWGQSLGYISRTIRQTHWPTGRRS